MATSIGSVSISWGRSSDRPSLAEACTRAAGPDLETWLASEPERSAPILPHVYAKMKRGTLRLHRVPSAEEQRQLDLVAQAKKASLPQVVQQRLDGAYFVALAEPEELEAGPFARTVSGRYVRREDLNLVDPPEMHGEKLEGELALPLAFVFGEDREGWCRTHEGQIVRGTVRKHARFVVKRHFESNGRAYVESRGGIALPREAVRLAQAIPRPSDVGAGAKWIHIDLGEQTLVAYEGDRPVFATLVSTGKQGHAPPTGLFRIRAKYTVADMEGPDAEAGWYEVQAVPWTMYYYRGYAVHGAYWHDDFGQVRSHGCTNLAPADARWLFHWTSPTVAEGKRSGYGSGTRLYFTG